MSFPVKQGERSDVLIAGGGPAGICAALAAARQGARVLLLEAGSAPGGMATQGLVPAFAPMTDKTRLIYRSLPVELVARYKREAGVPEEKWDWVPVYPEVLKRVLDDMLAEAGVTVLFGSRVCGVRKEGARVRAVLTADAAGLTEYEAAVFVDATGNGDLAVFAGADYQDGDGAGNRQPASLCFVIAGYHADKLTETVNSNPRDGLWSRILATGRYPLLHKHFIPTRMGEDVLLVNGGHLAEVDPSSPGSVSRAYVLGRKVAAEYLRALQENVPEAFGDAVLVTTAPVLGVREGRRVLGDYLLTAEDYLLRRHFEDEIAENCYWLDCHGVGGKGRLQVPPEKRHYAPGETHGIPYRCLFPRGLGNVLTAGRCASLDRTVFASVRVMPNCMAMGEAAGVCAALAAAGDGTTRSIPVQAVLERIK